MSRFTSLPFSRRCVLCSSPSTLSPASLPLAVVVRLGAYSSPRSFSSTPSSSPSSTSDDALQSLRSAWPSAPRPRPPTTSSPSPSPSSSPSPPPPPSSASRSNNARRPPSALRSSSSSRRSSSPPLSSSSSPLTVMTGALSSAELRSLSLAQREAEREAQQEEHRRNIDQRNTPSSSSSVSSAVPSPRLPPLLDERGRIPSSSSSLSSSSRSLTPSSSSPAPRVVSFDPLVPAPSISSDVLTEEDKAEQMALIDELTDYLRSYRHPTSDRPSSSSSSSSTPSALLSSPSTSLHPSDFFYDRPETTATFNHFITNHALHQSIDRGLALQLEMRQKGIMEDEDTFAALVQVCGAAPPDTSQDKKEQLAQRAADLLTEMKEKGFTPSLRFFNCLLETWTRLGDASRALTIPTLLTDHSLVPSAMTFTSLLSLYRSPAVSFDQLKSFWYEIRHVDPHPDVISYNAIIRAAAHHGEVEFALQVYSSLMHAGLHPSSFTYNSLMYACAKRSDYYLKCFDLYQEAMANQYQPDRVMMSTLLFACANNGDLSNAIRVFEQMEQHNTTRDTIAYNTLIQCIANTQQRVHYPLTGTEVELSQQERMDMTERLLIQMEANDVPITDRTLYLTLRVWTMAGRLRTAEKMREELIRRYVKLSEEEQRSEGRGEFNPHLWTALLDMNCRARRVKECREVVERMERKGLTLPSRHYDRLLHLCAVKGEAEWGRILLSRMRSLNLRPRVAEHERLFDEEQYRQWRRSQREKRMEGAVPAVAEEERERIRAEAWFGAKGIRRQRQRRTTEEPRPVWRPSNMERRAAQKEMRERRWKEKTLQQEKL